MTKLLCFFMMSYMAVAAQDSAKLNGFDKFKLNFHKTFYKADYGRNIIRYNTMPSLMFAEPRNFSLGYERTIKNNSSVSVNIGRFFLPFFLSDSIVKTSSHRSNETGFILSLDYRKYLKNLNARPAPNGVYIGPYLSVYHTKGATNFSFIDTGVNVNANARLDYNLWMANLGFQVGYQFIFAKRITVDVIMFGPGVSVYNVDFGLTSDLSAADAEKFKESALGQMIQKFPAIKQLVDIGGYSGSGSSLGFTGAFRYTFQIGYHF